MKEATPNKSSEQLYCQPLVDMREGLDLIPTAMGLGSKCSFKLCYAVNTTLTEWWLRFHNFHCSCNISQVLTKQDKNIYQVHKTKCIQYENSRLWAQDHLRKVVSPSLMIMLCLYANCGRLAHFLHRCMDFNWKNHMCIIVHIKKTDKCFHYMIQTPGFF